MTAIALSGNVLVLNKFYMALEVISVRRAFTLLAKRYAEVVHVVEDRYHAYDFESWIEVSKFKERFEEHEREWIRTVSMEILVPRIIRLVACRRIPNGKVKFNRRNIYARDEHRCQYCGGKFHPSELSLDHVVPKSRGGRATWTNLVVACTDCNARKGGRLPEEARMHLIRPPFTPKKSPLLELKTRVGKYRSWERFLADAYWSVELK